MKKAGPTRRDKLFWRWLQRRRNNVANYRLARLFLQTRSYKWKTRIACINTPEVIGALYKYLQLGTDGFTRIEVSFMLEINTSIAYCITYTIGH